MVKKHILSITNKQNTHDLVLTVLLLLFLATAAHTQEKIADGDTQKVSPSFVLQEKVRQWVQAQKLRSKERADWSEQKRDMAALNGIRIKEIEQIDSLIAAAGKRLSDATKKREELLDEQESLRNKRAIILKRVEHLETTLRAQLQIFPEPLMNKINDEVERIRQLEPSGSLQDRLRDLVAVMSAASEFGQSLTIHSQIRADGEDQIEVEVLYLGFSGAWYVGRAGKVAGYGRAHKGGWIWSEDNSVAGPLKEAIEMYRKERAPDYVQINFSGKKD
tara:strand:- start:1252 stop:2079 length:828 start_codon:yes stop_codon:yes gene_type:complete